MRKHVHRTSDPEYRRRRELLKAQSNLTCWLCNKPIDKKIKWPDPLSFTADHVEPVATGGHNHGRLRPAHFVCNSRRQQRSERLERSSEPHAMPW